MEEIESKNLTRKRLVVFALVAYGISFLMMIPMYIGKQNGMDLTQIVNAQMCSPAAGVALGYLLFYKGEKRVPKMFMIVLVINYAVQLVLGLLSVFANPFTANDVLNLAEAAGPASDDVAALAGSQSVLKLQQLYLMGGELILIGCSILLWIGYFTAGRERRKFAGIARNNEGKGVLLVLLFVGLYCLRIFVPAIAEAVFTNTLQGFAGTYANILTNPLFYLSILSLPINYPLTIIAFLGEEYGWRHFLQPIMQKKFGMKLGVILLGIVWGLWHIPVDTMYYTQDSVPQMIIGQIITCVSIGIFFGYVYLKTNNIWIPVCMHFLNNNLIPILTGEFTSEVLEDQHVPWEYLIEILIIDFLVFCLFIFAKEYKEKKKTKEALNA